jgi:hypothetical protein
MLVKSVALRILSSERGDQKQVATVRLIDNLGNNLLADGTPRAPNEFMASAGYTNYKADNAFDLNGAATIWSTDLSGQVERLGYEFNNPIEFDTLVPMILQIVAAGGSAAPSQFELQVTDSAGLDAFSQDDKWTTIYKSGINSWYTNEEKWFSIESTQPILPPVILTPKQKREFVKAIKTRCTEGNNLTKHEMITLYLGNKDKADNAIALTANAVNPYGILLANGFGKTKSMVITSILLFTI